MKYASRLTPIKFIERKEKRDYWLYNCICGNSIVLKTKVVKEGNTRSCGCLALELRRILNTTHGMSKTRFYRIFKGIHSRINNTKYVDYKNYGGRGIKNDWKTFEDFRNDMYKNYIEHVETYGEKQTTIDRINVNGNYCKENCRWATMKEQQNNRRNTRCE